MKSPVAFGKYLLLDRINVGGMAEVFLARSAGVEGVARLLAIKKIIPTMVEDEEFIGMFIDEARIAVQLNHANIVQILELGKHEEHYFIAMEYISGRDLRGILDGLKKRRQRLPREIAVYLAYAMCQALDYAHRKKDTRGQPMNIVHRDVSPQNVLVSWDGDVKIIDFGIAKAATRSQKTQAGILKGKFGYMSPEQVRGQPVDRRSDIFALGVVIYEMLTGERLFVGESDFSTLEKVRAAEVLPPHEYDASIPPALDRMVLKALAREPTARWQWAGELAEQLVQFMIADGKVFGQKQLAAFMQGAFAAEMAREQERLAAFTPGAEKTEVEGPEAQGGGGPPPPVADGPAARALAAIEEVEARAAGREEPEVGAGDKTQLLNPGTMLPDLSPRPPPLPGHAGRPPAAPPTESATVIRHEASLSGANEASLRGRAGPSPSLRGAAPPVLSPAAPPERPEQAQKTVIRAEASLLPPPEESAAAQQAASITAPASRPVFHPHRRFPARLSVGVAAIVIAAMVVLVAVHRPPMRTGKIVISTHPPGGATVALDGKPLDENAKHAFVVAGVTPGNHLIAAATAFGVTKVSVVVAPGETRYETVELPGSPAAAPVAAAPSAATGPNNAEAAAAMPIAVTLQASVPTAELFVDGKRVGRGRYVLVAEPGHVYRLGATARGRKSAEWGGQFDKPQTIALDLGPREPAGGADSTHATRAEATPAARPKTRRRAKGGPPGDLIISSRPIARVFVDGKPTQRYTPVPPNDPLHLPSGDHQIHLESEDGKKADRRVSIQPNIVTRLLGVVLN